MHSSCIHTLKGVSLLTATTPAVPEPTPVVPKPPPLAVRIFVLIAVLATIVLVAKVSAWFGVPALLFGAERLIRELGLGGRR